MILRPELYPLSINGDLRRGGWLMTGQTEGDTDAAEANLNLIMDSESLADYSDYDWREAFNFHVLADPDFSFDRYSSRANWQNGTVDNFLKVRHQSVSFATVASPANSHEATSWNFGQVVTHLLQAHSNAIYDATGAAGSPDGRVTTTAIDVTNSTEFELFIVRGSDNLWSALQNVGGGETGGEFYLIWCDRQNVIHYQPHPAFLSPQPAALGTLTKSHLRGQVRVQNHSSQPGQKISQIQLSAVANRSTVYSASYPASPAGEGEIKEINRGIWAHSQARANSLATNLYKWLTRPYTLTVTVDAGLALFGDDGAGLDLGDRVLMTYDGPAEDAITGAGVHLDISAASFFVYAVDIRPDIPTRTGSAVLTLEADNG